MHGASPAQTSGKRNGNGGCKRHGPGQGRAVATWPPRPPHGTASGQPTAQLSALSPRLSGSSIPVRGQTGLRAQGRDMCTLLATMPLTPFLPSSAPPDDGTRTARTTTVESSFVRRSESKAAWCRPVPTCLPASSGSSLNSLSVLSSVCFSVQLSLFSACGYDSTSP